MEKIVRLPKDLSDQELNEWVHSSIMGLRVVLIAKHLIPNYCNNLNHAHLMEEKIREMGEFYWLKYIDELIGRTAFLILPEKLTQGVGDVLKSTARQRCEAAWLALKT